MYPILTTIHYGSIFYPFPITVIVIVIVIVYATGLVTNTNTVVGNYRKGLETIATSD